jgi:methyltransferase (TIGR00027 family)
MAGPLIRNISDTALWVAVYRAMETDRNDAVFRDPFARRLAGTRGDEIMASIKPSQQYAWSYTARTHLIDTFVLQEVARGADMVIDLAAGLDARPFRMALPASLRWVEIDLAEILDYKADILKNEKPVCRLERIPLDLADAASRRRVLADLGRESKRALVISEGLLVYLDADEVCALARDLAEQSSFQRWATDLTNPALLKMLQRQFGSRLDQAGAPLKFGPAEGPHFFERCGWQPIDVRGMLHTAARLRRLSFLFRLFALLPDTKGEKPKAIWGGVVLLEAQRTAVGSA